MSVGDAASSATLNALSRTIEEMKISVCKNRTAKAWLQVLDMTDLLARFIKSKRTGNWQLSRQAQHDVLPYLAASGHNNCTKSLQLYLSKVETLDRDHPRSYKAFINCYHVICKSKIFGQG